MLRVIAVNLVLNVNSDTEAYDAVNEILREQQDTFVDTSCLVDYAIASTPREINIDRPSYEEGDAFKTQRKELS